MEQRRGRENCFDSDHCIFKMVLVCICLPISVANTFVYRAACAWQQILWRSCILIFWNVVNTQSRVRFWGNVLLCFGPSNTQSHDQTNAHGISKTTIESFGRVNLVGYGKSRKTRARSKSLMFTIVMAMFDH